MRDREGRARPVVEAVTHWGDEGIAGATRKTVIISPYSHEHGGVEEIPWSRLGELLIALAEQIGRE